MTNFESKIIILLFIAISCCSGTLQCNLPNEEQCDKLIDAVWKNAPSSIDICFDEKIFRKPMSEKELRKKYEDVFSQTDGPKDKMNNEKRKQFEKDVQLNVERALKERNFGVNVRKRIRLIDNCLRIDQTTIRDRNDGNIVSEINLPEVKGVYDITSILSGPTNLTCYHATKTMEIRQHKKEQIDNSDLKNIVNSSIKILQGLLADRQNNLKEISFIPSQEKIDSLIKTGNIGGIAVRICLEPNTVTLERIEIRDVNNGALTAIFICDVNDYSRVYYTELRMPPTGKPFYIKECNNFDLIGIPQNIAVTEFEFDGSLKEKNIYEVIDVKLNVVIPSNVFKYTPPEEYKIVEVNPNGDRKVLREKGGIEGGMVKLQKAMQEKDISTLTELLGHEVWQVRLRSLQILEKFLANDKEGLTEAATVLKNDKQPQVRKEAEKVLNNLESKPNTK